MSNYGDYRDVEVLRKRGSELEAELARCVAEYHAQADRAEKAERERDEARAEAMRLMQLCADRPNLDHIPFQLAPVEDWFNRIDNAEHQARVLPSPECSCSALNGGGK